MEEYIAYLRELNMCSMMLRILLAVIMGGAVGFDREKKRQPAGFRTYMLVAMGAAITMILGQYLDTMLSSGWSGAFDAVGRRTDVVRLGARVISGIGFIGTGTIIVTSRSKVKGLTTASGLWVSACAGLAVGAGFYECMIIGFILMLICMKLLPIIEDAVVSRSRNMNIYIEMDSIEHLGKVVNRIKAENIHLFDVDISKEQYGNTAQINGCFSMQIPGRVSHTEILAMLSTIDGVIAIDEI